MDKFEEYTATGVFPTVVIPGNETSVKSLTATHKITARSKAEAAKIYKQAGLLQLAPGKFLNSGSVVYISILTEDELLEQNTNDKEAKKED